MNRGLLALGLGLYGAGHLYWTVVSLSMADGIALGPALSLVVIFGILTGLAGIHRWRPEAMVLGFGLAAVAELAAIVLSGGGPARYTVPSLVTAAGFGMTTWGALATDGIAPGTVARRVGAGFLVAGIGGVAWLYGNLVDGNPIWIPGSFLVGAGAALAFVQLRRAPPRAVTAETPPLAPRA